MHLIPLQDITYEILVMSSWAIFVRLLITGEPSEHMVTSAVFKNGLKTISLAIVKPNYREVTYVRDKMEKVNTGPLRKLKLVGIYL